MSRRRLDAEMVQRGLAPDTLAAAEMIKKHEVLVRGAIAVNPGALIAPADDLALKAVERRFASRGGDKLEGALERFGLDPSGMICLDAGAGSGGFTDCLLKRGASKVTAVDVGYGQFDWRLRNDERVHLMERTNIRTDEIPAGPFDLVVADLSFIGLSAVIDRFATLSSSDALWVLLVKPQFETRRSDVPSGGVVVDEGVWRSAMASVANAAKGAGYRVVDVAASYPKGMSGNQEFFILAATSSGKTQRTIAQMIDHAIEEAR